MSKSEVHKYRVSTEDLQQIFKALSSKDYQNIGPIQRDGAIMLEKIQSFDQLAAGFHEDLDKGVYRLSQKNDGSLFQYTVGPQSFKKYLYPPRRKLWAATKTGNGFNVEEGDQPPAKMAFWGIRSCEIRAIEILDRIFLRGEFSNKWYEKARQDLFIVAAGCTKPSGNCFCTSTQTGPAPKGGFDLSVVEVIDKKNYFILEIGSEKGQKLVNKIKLQPASPAEIQNADKLLAASEKKMSKRFDPEEAAKILMENPDHIHWNEVAKRCLSCANCTLVCPTCFCSSTEDITEITGDHTERWLRWDSCFNGDFSYIHGGQIRPTTKSRYRQWLTHKMSGWYDQFDSSGCVGCGRCITWCPVGIDLTEELLAMKS